MFTASSKYMNYDEKSRLQPESNQAKGFLGKTLLEKVLIFLLVIFVLAGIGLSVGLVSVKKGFSGKNHQHMSTTRRFENASNVCFTPSCVYEASNLLRSIDMNVDPCTDFYSFVCGNWIKNTYLLTTLESQFTKMARSIILRVKGILEDLGNEDDLPVNKAKTKDFFESCMDKMQRSSDGATELLSDLKKFGGWPLVEDDWSASKFNWSDLIIQLFKNGYVNNMLFTIRVDIDVKNTSRSLISVSQPSLGLRKRLYYVISHDEITSSYKNAIFKIATHLYPDRHLKKEKTMESIAAAFELEKKIAKIMKVVNMKYPEVYYNIMSLEELEMFAPKIPWKYLLENMLPPNTKLTKADRIMITVPSMIENLNKILEEMDNDSGKKVLSNYIFYRVVFFAAHHLTREFYSLISGVLSRSSFASFWMWQGCVKTTMDLFPLPLTSSYAAKYMDNSTKELLGVMFQDIKKALINGIKDEDWLDDETKSYALFKVDKMRAAIAYQDEIMDDRKLDDLYKDINITESHFSNVKQLVAFKLRQRMKGLHKNHIRFSWSDVENLLTANAYYQPTQNAIIIPVGVLQETVFASDRPNYINYGSLGMIVGHELTHAFDSIGSLYDADGSYRMWWSQNSWKKFEDRVKCYEKQYNNYYMPAADDHINGTLTLGENIADNGGLQAAYYAYNLLLKRMGSEKFLPGLPYNEKQMFWISFGSVWCRKQTEESVHYSTKHSVHTPSQFRVIGSLSNMKEFAEDFKCKLNSTMHPVSKCTLWK